MSAPRTISARRPNTWATQVRPLHGPAGTLWLEGDGKLLGLDPRTGARTVDQPFDAGPDDAFVVSRQLWPYRVQPRTATPLPTASVHENELVVTVGGSETRAALPKGFNRNSFVKLDAHAAWLTHDPSRGPVKMRVARFDFASRTFGPVHELPLATYTMALDGGRIALMHERVGRVVVLGAEGESWEVTHVPSAKWGHVALRGDWVAVIAHQNRAEGPGSLAGVGVGKLGDGALRRFALRTQGATNVTFVDGALAVHQYTDVTLVELDELDAMPAGAELELAIEDIATPPPTGAGDAGGERVKVLFFGASTGFGFVESATHGRLRFQGDGGAPISKGDEIVIDALDRQSIARWHRPGAGPRALDEKHRCLEPMPWGELESRIEDVRVAPDAGPPALPAPDAAYRHSVWYGAELLDPDDDEEPVLEPDALRALDGVLEVTGDLLDHLFDEELDRDVEIVALRPTLRYVEPDGVLRLAFEFYTQQLPSQRDLASFAQTAERLLDSGWGMNYEFEPPREFQGCRVALDYVAHGVTTSTLDAR